MKAYKYFFLQNPFFTWEKKTFSLATHPYILFSLKQKLLSFLCLLTLASKYIIIKDRCIPSSESQCTSSSLRGKAATISWSPPDDYAEYFACDLFSLIDFFLFLSPIISIAFAKKLLAWRVRVKPCPSFFLFLLSSLPLKEEVIIKVILFFVLCVCEHNVVLKDKKKSNVENYS